MLLDAGEIATVVASLDLKRMQVREDGRTALAKGKLELSAADVRRTAQPEPGASTLRPYQPDVWAAGTHRRQSASKAGLFDLIATSRCRSTTEHRAGGDRGSSGQRRSRADPANRGAGKSVESNSR
jgi:hypothetical protein